MMKVAGDPDKMQPYSTLAFLPFRFEIIACKALPATARREYVCFLTRSVLCSSFLGSTP